MEKRLFDVNQIEALTDAIVATVEQNTAALAKLDPATLDEPEAAKGSDGFVAMLPSIAATILQHIHAIEQGSTEAGEPVPEEWIARLVAADLRIVDALQQMAGALHRMELNGPLLHVRGELDAALDHQLAAAIDTLRKAVPGSVN